MLPRTQGACVFRIGFHFLRLAPRGEGQCLRSEDMSANGGTRSPPNPGELLPGNSPGGAPHFRFPPICPETWGRLGTSVSWLPAGSPLPGVTGPGRPLGGPSPLHTWGQDQPGCWLASVLPDLEPFGEKCAFLWAKWFQEISTYSCANAGLLGSSAVGALTSEEGRGLRVGGGEGRGA